MKDTLPIEHELEILHNIPISMEIKPDENLGEWQKKAREKLRELIGLDKYSKTEDIFIEESRTEHENFTEIRFRFQSEKDYFVPCIFCVPKGGENPPVMICLQGHGTGFHISMGIRKYEIDEKKIEFGDRDFAVQCIEKGICALCIEQRNFGEKGGNPRPVCHGPSMVALLTGRTTIGARVWDIMGAMDALKANYGECFNNDEFYCMGNSGGGTATFYAAAMDERIKAAIPSCAFCTFEDSIVRQNHCECNYIPGIRNYFDMAEIAGLIAPRPLVIVSGVEDGIFPLCGAEYEFARLKEKYYAKSEKPGNCIHVKGDEGHRFYAKPAWEAFDKLMGGYENV